MLLSASIAAAREIAPEPAASARRSAPCLAAYPISATAPHATLCPHTPCRRRLSAIELSHALAAACGACPAEPISPATDEYTLKTPSGVHHVAPCTEAAPCTLGPYVARKLSACWLARMASASW